MAGIGKLAATITAAAALAGSPVQAENPRDFSGLMESGNPLVSTIVENTQKSTSHLMQDTGTIVLAQAEVAKKYVVTVIQIDGTKKDVEYTKNERGVIIPPKTTDKLLDGRPLTGNPVEDRALNREILGKYDKDKQIILAMNSKEDIVGVARKNFEDFMRKLDLKLEITKTDLYNAYNAAYIFSNFDDTEIRKNKGEKTISILDKYASNNMKMSQNEIEQVKSTAKNEAQKQWQSVTRSLG